MILVEKGNQMRGHPESFNYHSVKMLKIGQSAGKILRIAKLSKGRDVMLSSRNKAKAYLLGVYLGDGCLSNPKRHAKDKRNRFILVGVDLDLFYRTRHCIERVFPHLQDRIRICHERNTKSGDHYYRMYVDDDRLANFLLRHTGERKNHLPVEHWLYKPSICTEFVAGLMDTDGWIEQSYQPSRNHTPRWGVGFANTSLWVFDFRDLLIKFGVKVSGLVPMKLTPNMPTQNPDNWNTAYRMTFNVQSFNEAGLFFRIWRKRGRMVLRNWWYPQTYQGCNFSDEVLQKLITAYELRRQHSVKRLAKRTLSLENRLLRRGVLYRRAINPQRPEVAPRIQDINPGDVRVQLRGKPGRNISAANF